jgi:hypothetical protein
MPTVSCDFMVPLTVRVDTDLGEVLGAELYLESFQSCPQGVWVQERWWHRLFGRGYSRVTFRSAWISDYQDDSDEADWLGGEFVDGENETADAALALADRIAVDPDFMRLRVIAAPTEDGDEG